MSAPVRSRPAGKQQPKSKNEPLLFREQLAFLMECLPVATFVCDVADPFCILFVNPAIEAISGYSPAAVTGTPDFWTTHIHPEDRSLVLEKLPDLIGACDAPLDYRFLISDGTYKWFRERRKRVDGVHGTSYLIGFWQDISQEKQLRMESEYRLQQVIQADKLASLGEGWRGLPTK